MNLQNVLDLFLPRHCAACGTSLLTAEKHLCSCCAEEIPLTYFWTQGHNAMADKLNAAIQAKMDTQGSIPDVQEPYSYALALYFYKLDYRKLSQALKYDANIPLGRYLASALARKIRLSPEMQGVDLVMPVPLHFRRRLRRGYNQAEVIASIVAGHLGIPMNTKALKRCRNTDSQAKLEISQKADNVAGAFSVNFKALTKPDGCVPRHILLIDDVFTTGSTISECHRALRRALAADLGPKQAAAVKISAATLAFVGE